MKPVAFHSLAFVSMAALAVGMAFPQPARTQEVDPDVKDAYFRAVGDHFNAPPEEVAIIGAWNLSPDEVPVVFFMARHAGVSPDVLIGLRRDGMGWQELGRRFGIQTPAFHVSLPAGGDKGPLARAYEAFAARPAREWREIQLQDEEIVALVNLKVLTAQTGAPPLRILGHFAEAGSFVSCYPLLLSGVGGRSPSE